VRRGSAAAAALETSLRAQIAAHSADPAFAGWGGVREVFGEDGATRLRFDDPIDLFEDASSDDGASGSVGSGGGSDGSGGTSSSSDGSSSGTGGASVRVGPLGAAPAGAALEAVLGVAGEALAGILGERAVLAELSAMVPFPGSPAQGPHHDQGAPSHLLARYDVGYDPAAVVLQAAAEAAAAVEAAAAAVGTLAAPADGVTGPSGTSRASGGTHTVGASDDFRFMTTFVYAVDVGLHGGALDVWPGTHHDGFFESLHAVLDDKLAAWAACFEEKGKREKDEKRKRGSGGERGEKTENENGCGSDPSPSDPFPFLKLWPPAVRLALPKGSAVIYNARLLHQGSANTLRPGSPRQSRPQAESTAETGVLDGARVAFYFTLQSEFGVDHGDRLAFEMDMTHSLLHKYRGLNTLDALRGKKAAAGDGVKVVGAGGGGGGSGGTVLSDRSQGPVHRGCRACHPTCAACESSWGTVRDVCGPRDCTRCHGDGHGDGGGASGGGGGGAGPRWVLQPGRAPGDPVGDQDGDRVGACVPRRPLAGPAPPGAKARKAKFSRPGPEEL